MTKICISEHWVIFHMYYDFHPIEIEKNYFGKDLLNKRHNIDTFLLQIQIMLTQISNELYTKHSTTKKLSVFDAYYYIFSYISQTQNLIVL